MIENRLLRLVWQIGGAVYLIVSAKLAHDAADDIRWSAGGKGDYDPDGFCWVVGSRRASVSKRCCTPKDEG